jgi:hypothetical protein
LSSFHINLPDHDIVTGKVIENPKAGIEGFREIRE